MSQTTLATMVLGQRGYIGPYLLPPTVHRVNSSMVVQDRSSEAFANFAVRTADRVVVRDPEGNVRAFVPGSSDLWIERELREQDLLAVDPAPSAAEPSARYQRGPRSGELPWAGGSAGDLSLG